jgi:hypothetical protein
MGSSPSSEKESTAENIQFTDSTKYESIGPLNSPKLKIINADESDTGFYTCIHLDNKIHTTSVV